MSPPPGPRLLAAACAALAVLLCVRYDWWPSRYGTLPRPDPLLCAAVALVLLAGVLTLWAIRALYVVGRDRRWSWWVAPIPAVVVAASVLTVILPPPGFDDLRTEFERVATELADGPDRERAELEIGPIDLLSVREKADGVVYFVPVDGPPDAWAYAPGGRPAGGFSGYSAVALGGDWYELTSTASRPD